MLLDVLPLLVAVRYLEVNWHDHHLVQIKIDEKDDISNLRHWSVLHLTQVLTRYFTLRWYFFRITADGQGELIIARLEVGRVLLAVGGKVKDLDVNL